MKKSKKLEELLVGDIFLHQSGMFARDCKYCIVLKKTKYDSFFVAGIKTNGYIGEIWQILSSQIYFEVIL